MLSELTADLIASVPQTSPCLRFIDPWGDTAFNQLQIETLIPELQTLAPIPLPMIEFVSRWRGEAQTYLKFIGD